jgi:hypothetical protein
LNRAWTATVNQGQPLEPLAYARGLWPTSAAHSNSPGFLQGLEDQWQNYTANNFWQYTRHNVLRIADAHTNGFCLAVATRVDHLGGFLGSSRNAGTLQLEDRKQPGEHLQPWKRVRGWLEGQHSVMPSYSTAAELLLMQLDMLAYAE